MKNIRSLSVVVAAMAAFTINGTSLADPPPKYPHYKIIDLGTLGGQNSGPVAAAVTLNNRGEVIAQSSTTLPDPFPETPMQDGFIWHSILGTGNGMVRDLGGINGNQSMPGWITNNGLIAGFGENGLFDDAAGFPQTRALFWDASRQIFDLGTLGGNQSNSTSVNSRGQVVGSAATATSENPDVAIYFNGFLPAAQQMHAFLWERGSMRDLGTLGGNSSMAIAINEGGDVAGFSATDSILNETTALPTIHPFIYRHGAMRDIGTLGGSFATTGSFTEGPWGRVMNNRGQVIGTSMLAGDEDWHAFIYTGDRIVDLGTLGGNHSEALAINDSGQIVGRARTTNVAGSHHPFLWHNGQMTDLGIAAPCGRGTATSINQQGQVVGGFGACTNDPGQLDFFRAFYWEKGSPIIDLNQLVTPASDILVYEAFCINDRGEIAALGFLPDGSSRALLLVPIPGK